MIAGPGFEPAFAEDFALADLSLLRCTRLDTVSSPGAFGASSPGSGHLPAEFPVQGNDNPGYSGCKNPLKRSPCKTPVRTPLSEPTYALPQGYPMDIAFQYPYPRGSPLPVR